MSSGRGNWWNRTEKPMGMVGSKIGQPTGRLGWRSQNQSHADVSQPICLDPCWGKHWLGSRNLLSAGVQFGWRQCKWNHLGWRLVKRECDLTGAGRGHPLHHFPKHLPEMLGSFHSHGAWIAPCFLLSVTIAKALQVKIDLRSVLKLPETWYFLPGGIQVPLSIVCQRRMEAVMFTKLTNGLQVKHWAICETAFFFFKCWPVSRDYLQVNVLLFFLDWLILTSCHF